MILISVPPTESIMLSPLPDNIILSTGSAKQQSAKSCSGTWDDNGGSRGNRCSGNWFDGGSGNNDCIDNSNCNDNGDGDKGVGCSSKENSNINSGGRDSNSGGKNINQLKAAAEKAAKGVIADLTSTRLASWAAQWASKAVLRVSYSQRTLRASFSQRRLPRIFTLRTACWEYDTFGVPWEYDTLSKRH